MGTVGKLAASQFQKWYCGFRMAAGSESNCHFSTIWEEAQEFQKIGCHFLNIQCTEKLWVLLESWRHPGFKNGIAGSGQQPEVSQIAIFQQF